MSPRADASGACRETRLLGRETTDTPVSAFQRYRAGTDLVPSSDCGHRVGAAG